MKLILNLRDEQSPLLKAKVPISIFNQPFASIFTTATNSISDLSFSLSTAFPSGPCLKLTYAPSTSFPPFSLSLKSGLGLFGSPDNSPLVFSASCSLSHTTPLAILPTFSLHFKPEFGHFSLRKKTTTLSSNPNADADHAVHSTVKPKFCSEPPSSSEPENGFASGGTLGWQELKLEPYCGKEREKEVFENPNPNHNDGFLPDRQLVWGDRKKGGVFSGFLVKARTVFPLTKGVVVNLRWGVNLPGGLETKMPYLTVNKIGLERVAEEMKEVKEVGNENNAGELELLKGMCFWMRRDLEVLEKQNRDMKQSLEDMRSGILARNSSGGTPVIGKKMMPAPNNSVGEAGHRRGKNNDGEGSAQRDMKKPVNLMTDLENELQRAIKAAST